MPTDPDAVEPLRLKLTRANDADGFAAILAPDMLYVHESGRIYDGAEYVAEIRSRGLTYAADVRFDEDHRRRTPETLIALGRMGGHARLEGEAQVFQIRYLAVWVKLGEGWKLQLCQKTPVRPRVEGLPNRWL